MEDVSNDVTHLKADNSDGSEGLKSDHFSNCTNKLDVILSLLYTYFVFHGFGTYEKTTLGESKCRCHATTHCLINLQLIGYRYLKY